MVSPASITQSTLYTDLGNFLVSILPAGVGVLQGQGNRVAEPAANDFVEMTSFGRVRLATNQDTSADCAFTGSITGDVLTITEVSLGKPSAGADLFGVGLASNTVIGEPISVNLDGTGTYNISPSQTVSSRAMACGQLQIVQETEVTVQLDVHGPNSADNAQVISTLFRDQYAVSFFDDQDHGVSPLYADDPKQVPFTNENQQVEQRWVVDAHLQINPAVLVSQQFAQTLSVDLIEVEANFPQE